MNPDVYTVPEQIVFRHFELLGQGSSRTLLLQNKTKASINAYVSCPFTSHVHLHASDAQTLHVSPPHLTMTIQPGTSAKLTIELRIPEDDRLNYVQDRLVVAMGPTVLSVPIKAVRHSLDPAGGPQLQAILDSLPFWPSLEEMLVSSRQFLSKLSSLYSLQLQLPEDVQDPPLGQPAVSLPLEQPATSRPSEEQRGGGVESEPKAALASSLPPDAFSEELQACGAAEGYGDDLDGIVVPAPAVIKRPLVVQGRTAVVPRGPSGGDPAGQGRPGSAASAASMPDAYGASMSLQAAATGAGVGCVFLLNGRYHDSRGRDVTAEVASSSSSTWRIVDLSGSSAHRLEPPGFSDMGGERFGLTSEASSAAYLAGQQPFASLFDGADRSAGQATAPAHRDSVPRSVGGAPCSAPGAPDEPSRAAGQARAPVLAPNDPICASREGASRPAGEALSSVPAPPRERFRDSDPEAAGSRGVSSGDAVRQEALASAMRELGLSHLPPPRPASMGAAGAASCSSHQVIDMRLRPRSGLAQQAASSMVAGRLLVPGSAGDGDNDLEDDFEARLQRNIDMSMPPGAMAAGGPGSTGPARLAPGSWMGGKSGSPSLARSASLAPLPRRHAGGTVARPQSAARESQQGYCESEDEVDAQLQRYIDTQIQHVGGTVQAGGGSRSSGPRNGKAGDVGAGSGKPGGVQHSSASSGPALEPAQVKGPGRPAVASLMAPTASTPANRGASVPSRIADFAPRLERAGKPPQQLQLGTKGAPAATAAPSKEKLRTYQAAWDAL